MVSLNRKQHLQPTTSRSHSPTTITPSIKKSSSSTNAMAASDPDLAKQLFKANVKLAIDDRISGSSSKYEELRLKFTSSETTPIELCQYLAALTHFVTRLEPPMYASLVRSIVSLNWITYPPALTQIYIQFLGTLATAHTTYLPMMLSCLLGEFTDVSPSSNGKRTDLQLNAHWAIQHLLDVVPSGHTILLRLIKETFPHKSADRREQVSYVFNIIRISQYAEHLKGDILSLCIERIVLVDVEIQYELDKLEDDLEEELLLSQYDGRPYSTEDDINTEPPTLDDTTETSSGILDTSTSLATLRETITTLDALMTTLLNYLDPLFPKTSYPTLEAENLFDSLLNTFLTSILPTYHSRHAQFLVFRTSQSHSLFLDRFLGLLIERSLDPSLPNIARQASSAYLASFIARAKEINPETIRTVVEMLCVFLSRVLDDMPSGKFVPGGVAGNNGLDGVYAIFQAVIYIYCFRWRELYEEDGETGETVWLPQLNIIQRMAWSGLNPLAHISQDVAQEFAHRSYELQHIFVHTILKENARKGVIVGFLKHDTHSQKETEKVMASGEMIEIHSSGARQGENREEEDDVPRDWYPFDPYALPRSKSFITECFLEYASSDPEDEEMVTDGEESDQSEDMDDED